MTAPSTLDRLTSDPAGALRDVAALMRKRAEAAQHFTSPWRFGGDTDTDDNWLVGYNTDNPLAGLMARVPDYGYDAAVYIASWHPAVALAVADLLDHTAGLIDANGGRYAGTQSSVVVAAVARAYLTGGETA